jgi:hypothetical protein
MLPLPEGAAAADGSAPDPAIGASSLLVGSVTALSASQKMVPRDESSIMRPRGAVAVGGVIIASGKSPGLGLGVVTGSLVVGALGRTSVFAAASSSPIADAILA